MLLKLSLVSRNNALKPPPLLALEVDGPAERLWCVELLFDADADTIGFGVKLEDMSDLFAANERRSNKPACEFASFAGV